MDTERIPTLSNQNARNSNHFSFSKSLSDELLPPAKPSPPPPTVMDKFKARLKQRDDEFRVSSIDDDDVPPASTDEIVSIYESVLSELTFNSKPIITDLTIIAGEQRAHAAGIADAICSRIIEVPVEQKLPSLYLLDSIVKNIGREYVRYFASRLPEVFCEAYRQVDPSLYSAMRHLFGTWKSVFPPPILHKIDAELQFTSTASNRSPGFDALRTSESPRPSHGIHVNPKYVRQLDHPGADSDGAGPPRLKSTENMIRSSYPLGNKAHASSYTGSVRPLSPHVSAPDRTLMPEVDEFSTGNSPRRLKRPSPGPMLDYPLGRSIGREEHIGQWRRSQFLDDSRRLGAAASFNPVSGREYQDPRALIDAYGNDDRDTSINKPVQIGTINIRGKVAPKSWQDTEEQEFDWEDMSPTLADHSGRSNGFLSSSVRPFGGSRASQGLRKLDIAPPVDTANNLSSQPHLPAVDDSSIYVADAIPSLNSGRGSIDKLPGFRNDTNQILGPRKPQGSWNMSRNIPTTSQHFPNMGRGRILGVPHALGTVANIGEQKPYEKHQNVAQMDRLPIGTSRTSSSPLDSISAEGNDANLPTSVDPWHPTNLSRHNLPILHPMLPPQGQIRGPFGSSAVSNAANQVSIAANIMNQGPKQSQLVVEQQFDKFGGRELTLARPPVLNQQGSFIPQNQQYQAASTPFRPQFPQPRGGRDIIPPSSGAMLPPQNMGPTPNFSFNPRGQSPAITAALANPLVPQPHLPLNNIPSSLYMQGGSLPPLPPGPPPAATQMLAVSESQGAAVPDSIGGSAYSGLFSSLMAQGLISVTNPAKVQDSIGLEFNVDLLKVRHESAVRALYADLPRQCTTCGLRFKCQEEHSSHMDWHVTKNRMSKNRKQRPPRKWFVSVSMWLSGAEALGAEAVPGFLPSENVEEKKSDEEMAVPADDDQTACALCGEPFDDFYSDETEEWMYRGAVYMNAPDGLVAGMDRSQLGPIVHAKCRSESTTESPGNFGPDEGGNTEEGSQRKRLRS